MSAAGRTELDAPAASDVAAAVRDAPFVRLFANADGDALAAAGVLARALDDLHRPFQVGVVETAAESADRIAAGDSEALAVTIGVDADGESADALSIPATDRPASLTAFESARELGATPDPVLALAGVLAAGATPGAGETGPVLDAAREAGVERRPGVGTPTADLADGLAHTTLARAPFSGDPGAAQATLAELGLPAELDADAHRRVASLFALESTETDAAPERAVDATERALRPHAAPADAPFETVEGYADVLSAVATDAPGTGVALALGHDARADAIETWRQHAAAAHRGLDEATTGRYDGLFVARVDVTPVRTTARLLRDFQSPEPVAMAVSNDEAAVAAAEASGVDAALAAAVEEVGGASVGAPERGYARYDGDTKAFIAAFREAL
ncbi:MAG TPA: exonuclease RecJ [Natronoarchaeum rubrum]|nr:exonuclease RecJ [Natronoarchaeum rubrum]